MRHFCFRKKTSSNPCMYMHGDEYNTECILLQQFSFGLVYTHNYTNHLGNSVCVFFAPMEMCGYLSIQTTVLGCALGIIICIYIYICAVDVAACRRREYTYTGLYNYGLLILLYMLL